MYATRALVVAPLEILREVDTHPECGSVVLEVVTPHSRRTWRAVRRTELAHHVDTWLKDNGLNILSEVTS
jgi:hypothetical protein